MAYTPTPTDVTQPLDSVFASTAAAEFRALKAYIATIVAGGGPGAQTPGMIADFAFATAPPGWLIADGSLINRGTYAALWTLVNSLGPVVSDAVWASGSNQASYSDGDGSTTFRLPDFRSMVRKGADGGRGYGTAAQGKFVGPGTDHYHKTAFGWDASNYFAWNDGSSNPIYGSDVNAGAARFSFATANASTNGRFARTDVAASVSGTNDWNRVASCIIITCIKT